MPDSNTEIEAKFYVRHLGQIEQRVVDLDAVCIQERLLETNLRFDTPEQALTQAIRVLRLRRDSASRMTYKGPGVMVGGVRLRQEIEFEVSDFENAKALLEALGFQVYMIYEKYRAIYELDGSHITFDQLPFGDFVEIEAPDPAAIRFVAQKLKLNWDARVNFSYAELFTRVQTRLEGQVANLTFADFADFQITPEQLAVQIADLN